MRKGWGNERRTGESYSRRWVEDSDGGSEAAPKKVSKRVHCGLEFRVRKDRYCEISGSGWTLLSSVLLLPAGLRSLFSQLEPQTSKGGAHLKDCCQNCGERFPGGPALAQEAGWWRVGPGKWSSARTLALKAQLHTRASQAGPVVKDFLRQPVGAWGTS